MPQAEKQNTSTKALPEKMNAQLYYGPQDVRYEEVALPKINDNEVLVKVNTAIVNGSSYKTYMRGHPVLVDKTLPSPFGHQFVGDIVEVGEKVKNFKKADRVVSLNSAPCKECEFCKKEKYSLCENLFFLNGAFAEYIKIPERIVENNLYKISENLTYKKAVLTESLAVVLHGIERSEITKEDVVCVIGTGAIGLLFTSVLKHKGIRVVVLGRNDEKLKIAKNLGAEVTYKLNANYREELKTITNGYGPDVVIEAVGNPEIWKTATEIVKRGGLVNFFGGCKKDSKVELDTYRIHYDELKLIGVFHHTPKHAEQAIQMLESNLDNIDDFLITQELFLDQLGKAFDLIKDKKATQIAIKC